jgi:hypothetical protein
MKMTHDVFVKQKEKLGIIFDAIINMRQEDLPPFKPGEVTYQVRLVGKQN